MDSSGQLNFAEFIDLIHYIGVHAKIYKHSRPASTLDLKTLRAQSKRSLESDDENNPESSPIKSNIRPHHSYADVIEFDIRKEEQTTTL